MLAYTYANNCLSFCSPNSQLLQSKELHLYTYQLALYLLTVHVRICSHLWAELRMGGAASRPVLK